MKTCFQCDQTLPLEEFYRHPEMADGHLNTCFACTRRDVTSNYASKRQQYAVYYKERSQRPQRKLWRSVYQKNEREKHPEKKKARTAVGNAIRDGRLIKKPCEVCGDTNAEAHHQDYTQPLDVQWLCFKHHRELGHHQTLPF